MGVVNRRATSELSTYRSAALFSVVVVFTVTSTVSVILRLVAKRLSKMRLAREDYTILAAQVQPHPLSRRQAEADAL